MNDPQAPHARQAPLPPDPEVHRPRRAPFRTLRTRVSSRRSACYRGRERALAPHIASGFIEAARSYGPGFETRPSLLLTLRGTGRAHRRARRSARDVVPADRGTEGWSGPLHLYVGEDGLYGRGVTDCLGHVVSPHDSPPPAACRAGPPPVEDHPCRTHLERGRGTGRRLRLDYVAEQGHPELLEGRAGLLYWLDSADFGPTVGTGGMAAWELQVKGVMGHSGMTQNCVNAVEPRHGNGPWHGQVVQHRLPASRRRSAMATFVSSTLKSNETMITGTATRSRRSPGRATNGGHPPDPLLRSRRSRARGRGVWRGSSGVSRPGAPTAFRVKTVKGERGHVSSTRRGGPRGHRLRSGSPGLEKPGAGHSLTARGPGGLARHSMTGSLPLVRDLQRRGFDADHGFRRGDLLSRAERAIDAGGLRAGLRGS